MLSTKFLYEFDPLNQEFYIQKSSEDLALTFDPIQASSESGSPFKSISDSTIELEKKTIYVCKPSHYFFDSEEKYHQYLSNIQELIDRDFDVRIICLDEKGKYEEFRIDENLHFINEKKSLKLLADIFLLNSDPIDIKEARRQLNIVHDSSIFLEDFEIHKSKTKIEFVDKIPDNLRKNNKLTIEFVDKIPDNLRKDNQLMIEYDSVSSISDLEAEYSKIYQDDEKNYFHIFILNFLKKYLPYIHDTEKKISPELGISMIDEVFDHLQDTDKKFPYYLLDEIYFNTYEAINSQTISELKTHFEEKLASCPMPRKPLIKHSAMALEVKTFTQSTHEYSIDENSYDFKFKTREIPDESKLELFKVPEPAEKKNFEGYLGLFKNKEFHDQNKLIIKSSIDFKKDELVAISNFHRNALHDKIMGYSVDSDKDPKPNITFYQDPKTGLLYAKADQNCKANILLKNTYQNSNDRDIADIILLKQQDSEEFKKIVVVQNLIIYNLNDDRNFKYVQRSHFKESNIAIGDATSSSPDRDGANIICKYSAGKILSRNPLLSKPFATRDKNLLLTPSSDTKAEWLSPQDDEMKEEFSLSCLKNRQDFDFFMTRDNSYISESQTTAHFKSSMQAGNLIKLHSIASDDEILAFTVKTSDLSSEIANSNIKFFKDKDGYYYAQSDHDCVLEYVTQGTELQRYDVQDFVQNKNSLLTSSDSDLTTQDNFTKAVNILHKFSSNPNFQQSINPQDIKLPTLQGDQTDRYLDELFNNPASCRHRVMAVAHKFQKEGLKNGEDFRIIHTKGDHVEIELKLPEDNWVIINLGGENSQTIEAKGEALRPAIFSQTKSKILPTITTPTPLELSKSNIPVTLELSKSNIPVTFYQPTQNTTTILSNSSQGCFQKVLECFGLGGGQLTENQNSEESTNPLTAQLIDPIPAQLIDPIPAQLTMITPPPKPNQVLTPSPSPKPRAELSKSLIENFSELAKLTKIEKLISEPGTQKDKNPQSIQSIADDIISSSSANNSIYLKSSSISGQEALKCHLLATHRNSLKSDNSTLELNQEVAKTHYLVSSSKDLAIAKEVLFDKSQTANDNLELTANTRFNAFLQSARNEPQKSHLLIIDWNEFSDKMKVATNSMFDKSDRRIGNEKIPDNVKIICLDNSKQSNQDPSITSRFSQAFSIEVDESEIKIATQEISANSTQKTSDTSIPTKNINHDFDFAGLPDWKSALMGLVELQGDQISWTKSQFIAELQNISLSSPNQVHHFTFSNINKENQQQLTSFLEQSKALGYIEFQGQQIKFPQNFSFEFTEKEFDFARIMANFDGIQTSSSPTQISQPLATSQLSSPLTATSLGGAIVNADLVFDQSVGQNRSSQDLPELRIATNCRFHDLASDQSSKIYTVNSFSFDKLLTSPKIDDQGNFYQEKGIFEKHQEDYRGQNLKLFISGDLSVQQYYLLLSKAQELNIKLDLLLAPEVKLPKEIIIDEAKSLELEAEFPTKPSSFEPRIIVSNDVAKSSSDLLNRLKQSNQDLSISVVNVEDLVISDLFPSFDVKIKETPEDLLKYQFQLSKLTSEIDKKLAIGDKIIIKGSFDDRLIKMLHQHFLATEKSYENLYFVIEEKEQSVFKQEATTYKKLNFLPSSQYLLESHQLESKNKPQKITLPYFQESDGGVGVFQRSTQSQVDYSTHLTQEKIKNGDIFVEAISSTKDISALANKQISQQSESFITSRKKMLTELFEHSSLVKIVGESGVGKSSLLREFAKTAGDSTSPTIKTYNELDNLESWAIDKEGDNLKILVIDEYNVDKKMDYTMFRDFNQDHDPSKKREIFYQGKFYELTDKHKVVFMGNPAEYGNRKEGKLFKDTKVPTLELKDFPSEYIYQEILQKPILEPMISDTSKLPEEIRKSPELIAKFKAICDEEIKKYKAQNSGGMLRNNTELTVRELQEQVLLKLSQYIDIDKKIDPQSVTQEPISTADFIETSSTKDNIEAIRNALMIRQQQKKGLLPQSIIGTSGLIFEGDSGIGKSVMIEAVLTSQNITRLANQNALMQLPTLNNSTDQSSQYYYYKIPANISAQEIEQQLIEASKRGVIVVFDEINTRLNEGLEKTINALLTGSHPSSKESDDQPKAGFMIIGSINSAIYAGRSAMSPAIIHRSTYIKGKELKDYTTEDFKIIMQNWADHLTNNNDEDKMNQEEVKILQFKTSNPEKFEQLISNLAETFRKMLNPQELQSTANQNYKKISEIPAESLNIRNLKSTFLKSLSQEIEIEKSPQIARQI